MKTVYLIGGTRPNFIKISALSRAFKVHNKINPTKRFNVKLINTGQHYNYLLSKKIFEDLNIPRPAVDLGVGSGSHAEQTAGVMLAFERLLLKKKADLVLVVGDVNSTVACSLVAAKLCIPVAHVEAGLRSFDRVMPEEINRIVTDSLSDILFTSCEGVDEHLLREGVDRRRIHFVGNVMVDTLLHSMPKINTSRVLDLQDIKGDYAVLTLHRPSNVDATGDFLEILEALSVIQKEIPVIFPVHPRTVQRMKQKNVTKKINSMKNFRFISPLGYLDFIKLLKHSSLVLTDSGGIQEETTILKVPCVTLRENTERPITIEKGTSVLAGCDSQRIVDVALSALAGNIKLSRRPRLWDGKAAGRIVKVLAREI